MGHLFKKAHLTFIELPYGEKKFCHASVGDCLCLIEVCLRTPPRRVASVIKPDQKIQLLFNSFPI